MTARCRMQSWQLLMTMRAAAQMSCTRSHRSRRTIRPTAPRTTVQSEHANTVANCAARLGTVASNTQSYQKQALRNSVQQSTELVAHVALHPATAAQICFVGISPVPIWPVSSQEACGFGTLKWSPSNDHCPNYTAPLESHRGAKCGNCATSGGLT